MGIYLNILWAIEAAKLQNGKALTAKFKSPLILSRVNKNKL